MSSEHSSSQPQPASVLSNSSRSGLRETFDSASDIPAQLTAQAAQIAELRAEVEHLRAERDRLLDQQRRIAELLKCAEPHKVIHDLRNVLNELQLYKLLAETTGKR